MENWLKYSKMFKMPKLAKNISNLTNKWPKNAKILQCAIVATGRMLTAAKGRT